MKKLIRIMSLAVLWLFVSAKVYSYDFEVGGIYYGYNSNTQTAYVTNDYTKDFSYSGNIIIPNTVTYNGRQLVVAEIGEKAFLNCKNLHTVSLPNSIITIGDEAFKACEGIVSLSLPNSIKSIGLGAFSDCTGLKSIELPNELVRISSDLFSNCSSLENITIPHSVEDIGASAFQDCISLKSIIIPSNVTAIRRYAFSGCTGVETLVLEDGEVDLWIDVIVSGYTYTPFDGTKIKYLYIGRAYKRNGGYPADYSAYYPIDFSKTKVLALGESIKKLSIRRESIERVYSFAQNPENETVEFSNSVYINAKLYVPTGTKEKYMSANGWKNFFQIEEMDVADMWNGQGEPPTDDIPQLQKCDKPSIHYSKGKLSFECATDGATCQSTITDTDIASYSVNEIQLSATYNISVYASKEGFDNSDAVTATLCWIDADPKTEGIESGVAQVRANAVLIQSYDGIVSVEGVSDDTDIAVYDTSGQMVGSGKAHGNCSIIATNLKSGSIAIVRIGDKSVKIMMK